MAFYSGQIIKFKTFLLIGTGAPYGKPDIREPLVLDREAGADKFRSGDIDAAGFDIGSLRQSFDTHAGARTHLKSLQSGQLKINGYRKIDPQAIRIHEMAYEARAIDFDDRENEILTVIGALDTMPCKDADVFKATYPGLVDTDILPPPAPPFETHNGKTPVLQFSAYIGCSAEKRDIFNRIAGNIDGADTVPVAAGISTAQSVNRQFYGCHYFRSLRGLAEEIGKARLGLIDGGGYYDVLELRLYDTLETYTSRTAMLPVSTKINTLEIFSRQNPAVAQTLLDAMQARRINPFPS